MGSYGTDLDEGHPDGERLVGAGEGRSHLNVIERWGSLRRRLRETEVCMFIMELWRSMRLTCRGRSRGVTARARRSMSARDRRWKAGAESPNASRSRPRTASPVLWCVGWAEMGLWGRLLWGFVRVDVLLTGREALAEGGVDDAEQGGLRREPAFKKRGG